MIETTTLVALVIGLTQLFKTAFKIPSRFAPLLSLVFALALTLLYSTDPIADQIFTGIMIGLSSSGLYSATKTTIKG